MVFALVATVRKREHHPHPGPLLEGEGEVRLLSMTPRLDHYIAGQDTPPSSQGWLDVYAPATATVHARVAAGNAQDVERAVHAAKAAFPDWRALPASQRARWLERLADGIERRIEA